MAIKTPTTAARFGISIDGLQTTYFSELQSITTNTRAAPKGRGLLAHELTHVVQQNAGKRNVIILLTKPDASRVALQKLRSSARRQVKLTAYNQQGAPALALTGKIVKVEADALQQEWSLTYEAIQRVL